VSRAVITAEERFFPHLGFGRRVAHGEDIVRPIAEEHFRHRELGQQRLQDLHDLLFSVDAFDVAYPGIASTQARARLLENEGAVG
jgi:hypothetical protein